MDHLPDRGQLSDDQLEIIPDGGIVHREGKILATGDFNTFWSMSIRTRIARNMN